MSRNIIIKKYSQYLYPSVDFKKLIQDRVRNENNWIRRKMPVDMDKIETLHREFKRLTTMVQRERSHRAAIFTANHNAVDLKRRIEAIEKELYQIEDQLKILSLRIPNDTHPETPVENKIIDSFTFEGSNDSFAKKDHIEIGKYLDILDFDAATTTSGSNFYYLKGQGALLENALIQYTIQKALSSGYEFIIPPDIVHSKYIRAAGFFPRRECSEDLPAYPVGSDGLKCLAGTSEIPLMAYYSNQILKHTDLPIKFVALSHCFRPETGHHGSDSRGLFRVHQFTKVELFVIKDNCNGSSDEMLQDIVDFQKTIVRDLGLQYRVVQMGMEELGASAYQKYDIDAYFPCRRGNWGEISSASNCTDYQSRRVSLRYREADGSISYAHTLNGTAMAMPRIIQAIIENNQNSDYSVKIPSVLHPFMLDRSNTIP